MSRCSLPQHTFIWVLQLWPVLCVYTCWAFRVVAAALGLFCCFPSPLAWPWPRLMVDWTRKNSAALCKEAVKLSASFLCLQPSRDWQCWTDGWINSPTLTTSSEAFSSTGHCWILLVGHPSLAFFFLIINSGRYYSDSFSWRIHSRIWMLHFKSKSWKQPCFQDFFTMLCSKAVNPRVVLEFI